MNEQKYYLKSENDSVQGPYSVDHIFKLILRGELIPGTLFSKEFFGPWVDLNNLSDLKEQLATFFKDHQKEEGESKGSFEETVIRLNLAQQNKELKEIVQKESQLKQVKDSIEKQEELDEEVLFEKESNNANEKSLGYREFKFDKTEKIEIDYEELEKKYQTDKEEDSEEETSTLNKIPVEKTVVKKIVESPPIEKTKVINIPEKLSEQTQTIKTEPEENEEPKTSKSLVEEVMVPEEEIDEREETKVFNVEDIRDNLENEAEELEQKIIEDEEDEKVEFNEFEKHKKLFGINVGKGSETGEKKKIRPITAFAFVVVFYFLLFDTDDVGDSTKGPLFVDISGPVSKSRPNLEKAEEFFKLGIQSYLKDDYLNKIKAGSYFKKSVENKYRSNPALSWLILTYGDLLPESKNKRKAQKTVFNLIKQTRSKILTDVHVALGAALFYHYYGKTSSAFKVLENFLNLESPNKRLISLYLDLSIELGDLVTAQKIVERLEKTTDKPVETYLSLSRYYRFDQKIGDAKSILREGLKLYVNNPELMLEYNDYLIQEGDYKTFVGILKKVEELGAGRRPTLYAKYLEQMGILSVLNKDNQKASTLFRLALKIRESNSLRSKLAALEIGGDKVTKDLILESKVIELVRKSKKLIKDKEWDEALATAVRASDLNPRYIPAQIHLAKLQGDRGYYGLAIQTLEKAQKINAKSALVNFALVKAYLQADKVKEAKDLINIISNNNLRKHPLYPSIMGYYFFHLKNYSMANKQLSHSIVLNPLRDQDYFLMAKMFLMSRQYKEAKIRLNEAILLDPQNIEYKIMLSEITYELDGAIAAIGYLRKTLETHVDNPKLMGQIAKFYYKNGEIKQFEFYKDKIRNLQARDGDFYRFLFDSALLEEKRELALDYGLQLLNIEPGDVKVRLAIAEIYKDLGKLNEALEIYDSILARLSTYPTIHYQKAKVFILQKKYEQALEEAEKEIKLNPSLYQGYFVKGEVLRLKEKYDESITLLEKAISLQPGSVEALKSLGWIKLRQRYYNIAKELYLRAKRTAESDPEIRKQLCLIYEGLGQSRLAVEECQLYLKLYPNAPDRNTILKLINVLK